VYANVIFKIIVLLGSFFHRCVSYPSMKPYTTSYWVDSSLVERNKERVMMKTPLGARDEHCAAE